MKRKSWYWTNSVSNKSKDKDKTNAFCHERRNMQRITKNIDHMRFKCFLQMESVGNAVHNTVLEFPSSAFFQIFVLV
jgi:hypothetical protein